MNKHETVWLPKPIPKCPWSRKPDQEWPYQRYPQRATVPTMVFWTNSWFPYNMAVEFSQSRLTYNMMSVLVRSSDTWCQRVMIMESWPHSLLRGTDDLVFWIISMSSKIETEIIVSLTNWSTNNIIWKTKVAIHINNHYQYILPYKKTILNY